MKTLSVREVAAALDMTPRGVIQRLNKGQLKGTRKPNQFGVQEWLVYANKDIMQAIERKGPAGSEHISFSPVENEALEAEEIYDESEDTSPTSWRQTEIERLELLAEKLVKPLAERIEAQAKALGEQERVIEDQKRQLLLLPDLQKQAEAERKGAELKELEAEALRKQIGAMEAGQHQAEEARRAAEEEVQHLKEEKEAQAKAVQEQLQALSVTVQELKTPWWKKWFTAPEGQ